MTAQLTPHGATKILLRVAGRELAALRGEPPGRARAAAVLVPGFTGSKEDYAPLIDPLRAAGFLVLAVDLPGQYESPGSEREQDYRPDRLAAPVAEAVAQLAEQRLPVLLTGHSYGGLVCRSAVLAGAPVRGLVLLGSGPAALPPGERRAVIEATEPVLRSHGQAAVQHMMEARDGVVSPPELADLLRTRFLRSSTAGLLGMAEGLRTEPDRVSSLAAALRRRRIRCLVAFGARDIAWPVSAQREMAARLGAEVAEIPGAGHAPNTENPQALLGVLLTAWSRWLDCAEEGSGDARREAR